MTRRKVALMVVILCATGAIYLKKSSHFTEETIDQVRIAFTLNQTAVPKIDPAEVQSANQGILVDNLFSRLVEYDNSGQIQAGVASKFYWEGNSLVFEFGTKARTLSGHNIDADDAATSLRRLLKLDSNTHINLKLFLCDINSIEEVFRDCDAIKVKNNKLLLTPNNPKFKPFLLKALTSIDFGIIPVQQIDKKTLAILDLKETSGAYYLDYQDDQKWILKTNIHYNIKKTTPKEIVLVNLAGNDIWDHFVENKIDVVTTLNTVDTDILKRIKTIPNLSISETMDIRLFFIKFSPKAIRDFTSEQRLYLGERFRNVMKEKYKLPISNKPTNQFFLDLGYGHLSTEQEQKISSLRQNSKPGVFSRKPKFYLYKSLEKKFAPFKEIQEIDPQLTDLRPYMQKAEDRLDVYTGNTDTAYEESLAVLGYNFTQGTFGLNEAQATEWIEKYIDTDDEQKRFLMIQDLHYETLVNGITVPLFKAPYTAVARNHFKVNLSKIFASTQFWSIIKE